MKLALARGNAKSTAKSQKVKRELFEQIISRNIESFKTRRSKFATNFNSTSHDWNNAKLAQKRKRIYKDLLIAKVMKFCDLDLIQLNTFHSQ